MLILDLERFAERIGALTKAELRVMRDREDEDEDTIGKRRAFRGSVVKNKDDDDEWD